MENHGSSVQLPLRDAYPYADSKGLRTETEAIRDARPPTGAHQSLFRRALIARLLVANDLLASFITEHWPHGETVDGQALLRSYERLLKRNEHSNEPCEKSPGSPSTSAAKEIPAQFVVLVRGMAMFGKRRVKKQLQQDLLKQHLPESISVLGVFNKSGNYALSASNARLEIGPLVLKALQSHRSLRDLEYVSVVAASTVRSDLSKLVTVITKLYGQQF